MVEVDDDAGFVVDVEVLDGAEVDGRVVEVLRLVEVRSVVEVDDEVDEELVVVAIESELGVLEPPEPLPSRYAPIATMMATITIAAITKVRSKPSPLRPRPPVPSPPPPP